MKYKKTLLLLLTPIFFVGCTQVKSKEYYLENIDKAEKVMIDCEKRAQANKSIEGKYRENCINANSAYMQNALSTLGLGK